MFKHAFLVGLVMTGLLIIGCGDDPIVGPGANDPALIGTWEMVTVNGEPALSGVLLRYHFDGSKLTMTTDLDCTMAADYETDSGMVRATMTSVSGSQCGDEVGQTGSFRYAVEGATLTLTFEDEELGTGVFEFAKVG